MSFKICARNAKYSSLVVEREWKLVVYSAVFLRLATPKLFPETRVEEKLCRADLTLESAVPMLDRSFFFQRNFLTRAINFLPRVFLPCCKLKLPRGTIILFT